MKSISLLFVAFLVCLTIIGCAPKTVPLTHPTTTTPSVSGGDGTSSGQETGASRRGGITAEDLERSRRTGAGDRSLDGASAAAVLKDVYFEFDSYKLRQEDITQLKAVSEWLNRNKGITVTLEGHCDERGTAVYNLALGQKRAEAVRDYLVRSGVDQKRMKTLSYGKEQPVDTGNTEEAWARNRRVHFKVDQKG